MATQFTYRLMLCIDSSVMLLLLFLLISAAWAESPKYMGTASCSSSNCHGSTAPKSGSSIYQNEYVTWLKEDKHAQAWKVLLNEDSRRIAENLGIKNPSAEQLCLNCHATQTAQPEQRGAKFSQEDGVSCETCHGPSEHWLAPHTEKGSDHKRNVSQGMRELVPLRERAEFCVSCHYGTDEKSVNHRLIGAGHPRLSFELDTYGMIQPRHWAHDKDYAERKSAYHPVRAWLVGQTTLAAETTKALLSEKRSRSGIWPELSLFTCYSCHHSLLGDQWKEREYENKPGELRLNLATLKTVREALSVLAPELGEKLESHTLKLQDAYKSGEGSGVLHDLLNLFNNEITPFIERAALDSSVADGLLRVVTRFAAETPHFQYEEAEQLAMGVSAVIALKDPTGKLHKGEVDALYQALSNPEDFQADTFTAAAKRFFGKVS